MLIAPPEKRGPIDIRPLELDSRLRPDGLSGSGRSTSRYPMELIPPDTTLPNEIIAQVVHSNLEDLRDVRAMTEQPRAPVLDSTKLELVRSLVRGVLELLDKDPPRDRSDLIRSANLSYSAMVLGIVLYKDATDSPKVPRRRATSAPGR